MAVERWRHDDNEHKQRTSMSRTYLARMRKKEENGNQNGIYERYGESKHPERDGNAYRYQFQQAHKFNSRRWEIYLIKVNTVTQEIAQPVHLLLSSSQGTSANWRTRLFHLVIGSMVNYIRASPLIVSWAMDHTRNPQRFIFRLDHPEKSFSWCSPILHRCGYCQSNSPPYALLLVPRNIDPWRIYCPFWPVIYVATNELAPQNKELNCFMSSSPLGCFVIIIW